MGLNLTHNCFDGAYSFFHRWRKELARAAGLPPLELMEGFFFNDNDATHNPFWRLKQVENKSITADKILEQLPIKWDCLKKDSLYELLYHSDCDGHLKVSLLLPLAKRLEILLPDIKEEWKATTVQFIKGIKQAASKREQVGFH